MGWEFTILDALQQIHTPLLDKILVFITSLGNAGWFWIVLGLVLLCVKRYRKYGVLVLGALIFSALFGNIILKPLVARQRPCWINDTVELLIRVPKDYSFPPVTHSLPLPRPQRCLREIKRPASAPMCWRF